MFGKVLAIAGKDIRLFFRDPRGLALVFLMPFMFILVMSLALRGSFGPAENRPVPVLVVNGDRGTRAADVVAQFGEAGAFRIETATGRFAEALAEADYRVSSGERALAIVFPEDFSEVLDLGPGDEERHATVEVLIDPAAPVQVVEPIVGTLRGLVERAAYLAMAPKGIGLMIDWIAPDTPPMRRVALEGIARTAAAAMSTGSPDARVRVERTAPSGMRIERPPDSFEQNVPGYTVFGVFWVVALLAASVLEERRLGTFRRLLVAPLGRGAMLAGKVLPWLAVNLVQVAVMLGAAALLFDLDLGRSPAGLLLVAVCTSLAAGGLGVLVAAYARSDAQIGGLATLLLLTFSALGGCFVPRLVMPEWLRTLGFATPHAWALDGFQDLIVRGYGFVEVLPRCGVLLGFAAVFFAVGAWRFRFD